MPNGSSTYHCGRPGISSVRRTGWPERSSSAAERLQPGHGQGGVGLPGRPEVIFHPEVDLGRSPLEPAAAPDGELRRLGDPRQAEQPGEEGLGRGLRLGAGGHGQLDVVDALDAVRPPDAVRPFDTGRSLGHVALPPTPWRGSRQSGWSGGTSTRWILSPSGSSIQASIRPQGSSCAGRAAATPRPASSARVDSTDRTWSQRARGPAAGRVAVLHSTWPSARRPPR